MEKDVTFTERELDIMSVLWARGSGTVREILEELPEGTGYTTVLKFLQILERKGHIRHEEEGRAHRFIPIVAPEEAGRTALRRIVDAVFQGSAELTLARLVEAQTIPPDELRRMRQLLDELSDGGETGSSGSSGDPKPRGVDE